MTTACCSELDAGIEEGQEECGCCESDCVWLSFSLAGLEEGQEECGCC